ncbi:hypothetical protein ACFFX0_32970 [Citricoccus parietis]|uniref:Uncharacterized protein n=1 Tax=Citricoccus parietis TaxID=592307 RepID=A0ABV5G9X9_9MICC
MGLPGGLRGLRVPQPEDPVLELLGHPPGDRRRHGLPAWVPPC